MILPVIYFVAVLVVTWTLRRRLLGLVVLVLAGVPVYGFTSLVAYINRDPGVAADPGVLGFMWTNVADNVGRMFHVFSVAYLLVLWMCGAVMWRGHRAADTSIPCHHCGYDLRGNASGGCPECGEPVLGRNRAAIEADASAHANEPHASLPEFADDLEARAAGARRRAVAMPPHLRHDHTDPELLTRGASRARPHDAG